MYKHLTPQEIEEFEKEFGGEGVIFKTDENRILMGYTKAGVLSFIDTLIGKRVGEEIVRIEEILKACQEDVDFGASRQQLTSTKGQSKCMALLRLLSPDSPKRNEEHDHPSQ